MNNIEQAAKTQIIQILRKQGYPSYARLFDLFDLHLTDDPEVVGYMIPGKAKIVLNQELSIEQVSTLVRHEILHEYLTHAERQVKFEKEHPELFGNHELSNIAADFEISNRGYTSQDKLIARSIKLGDRKPLKGLVTELDEPGWENLTYEQMYEKLLQRYKDDAEKLKPLLDKISKLNKRNLEDMEQEAQGIQGKAQQQVQDAKDGDGEGEKAKADISKKIQDKAKDLEKAVGEIKDKVNQKDKDSQGGFQTGKEQKNDAEIADRVIKIKQMFADLKAKQELLDETDAAVYKDLQKQRVKKSEQQSKDPLARFESSLDQFIRKQTSTYSGSTWKRFNKTAVATGLLKPGRTRFKQDFIPLINVYWDVSGSFDDEAKTAGARQAISILDNYERQKLIKVDTLYFADKVSDTREGAGGGTRGTPILNDIKAELPNGLTNVIIITDGDITDCRQSVTVPGAVWMLFYDSKSDNLIEHLRGEQETQYFMVDY